MAELAVQHGFPEDQRATVAVLYWQAFGGKLGKVLHPEDRALRFVEEMLDPDFALSVLAEDGTVLGVAGFKTAQGALADGGLRDLAAIYGWPGALWRGLLLSLLERKVGAELLQMDGIFVADTTRGLGIGSALLEAIFAEAKERGLKGVRLDVIDANPRARALYERKGFMTTRTEHLGPLLGWIFGFRQSTTMVKRLEDCPVDAQR